MEVAALAAQFSGTRRHEPSAASSDWKSSVLQRAKIQGWTVTQSSAFFKWRPLVSKARAGNEMRGDRGKNNTLSSEEGK